MVLTCGLISILIVAAIYGSLVFIFWRDIRRSKKEPKKIHRENYWTYPIGQP